MPATFSYPVGLRRSSLQGLLFFVLLLLENSQRRSFSHCLLISMSMRLLAGSATVTWQSPSNYVTSRCRRQTPHLRIACRPRMQSPQTCRARQQAHTGTCREAHAAVLICANVQGSRHANFSGISRDEYEIPLDYSD